MVGDDRSLGLSEQLANLCAVLTSTTFPDATKTAAWLADAAAVEDRQEAAKFWQTLATKLLAPMLFAAARTGRTMQDVSHWVDTSAFKEVGALLKEQDDPDATAAWKAIEGLPNETRGSVLGTAMAIFRAFGSPRVQQATSCTPGNVENTLNVPEVLRENGTLYLVSPEYEQAELRPVFVALVQAVYRAAVEISANRLGGAPLNPPLLLMLDEAGNIAPLHSLPKIASTGAGQGISLAPTSTLGAVRPAGAVSDPTGWFILDETAALAERLLSSRSGADADLLEDLARWAALKGDAISRRGLTEPPIPITLTELRRHAPAASTRLESLLVALDGTALSNLSPALQNGLRYLRDEAESLRHTHTPRVAAASR